MAQNNWLNTLIQICLLKSTPEALPYNPKVTWGLTLGVFLIPAVMWLVKGAGAEALGLGMYVLYALHTAVYLTLFYGLLRLRGLQERFTQLWFAIIGTSLVIGLVNFVLVLIAPEVIRPLLLIFFAIWGFVVSLHIYCHGLEIGKFFAVTLMVLLQLLSVVMSASVIVMAVGSDPEAMQKFMGVEDAKGTAEKLKQQKVERE